MNEVKKIKMKDEKVKDEREEKETDEGVEGATSDEFLDEKGFSIGTEGEAHEEDDVGVMKRTKDIKLIGDDLHVFLRESFV